MFIILLPLLFVISLRCNLVSNFTNLDSQQNVDTTIIFSCYLWKPVILNIRHDCCWLVLRPLPPRLFSKSCKQLLWQQTVIMQWLSHWHINFELAHALQQRYLLKLYHEVKVLILELYVDSDCFFCALSVTLESYFLIYWVVKSNYGLELDNQVFSTFRIGMDYP